MAKEPIDVILDTSVLKGLGLRHPELQKLLKLSLDGVITIHVPFVAWEEWRTQLIEKQVTALIGIQEALGTLNASFGQNLPLKGLGEAKLLAASEDELDECSIREMQQFADDHRIKVVPLAPDHQIRAWRRYFRCQPPFNRAVTSREDRRKDIPDSWIYEATLDLQEKLPNLRALVADSRLRTALEAKGIRCYERAQEFRENIQEELKEIEALAAAVEIPEPKQNLSAEDELRVAMEPVERHSLRVLGFIAVLGPIAKDELYATLAKAGVPIEVSENLSKRLALAGAVIDTGNTFLAAKGALADRAKAAVEPDLIRIVGGDGHKI